jgi:L-asparaginase / beta-aspartyl-peptidase
MKKYAVAIHGGAGALSDLTEYRVRISEILNVIRLEAEAGMSALDLVTRAVTLLEDNPLFNAGKGSVLNAEGKVECDASIADGQTLNAGSVICVDGIKNPILLARSVMEESPHVMLTGGGAMEFAREQGFEIVSQDYFITEHRTKQLIDAKKADRIVLDHSDIEEKKLGPVGAVAIDADGNLAAATSTGGIVNKKFGRVGDSPIIGAGTFAENELCAISCTGYGEQFLRTVLAKHVAEYLRYHQVTAGEAAKVGIDFLVNKVNGLGGMIVVDKEYVVGLAHSTPVLLGGSVTHESGVPQLFF